MNTHANRFHSIGHGFVLALIFALAFWSPIPAKAGDKSEGKPAKMMACCKEMSQQHEKLIAEMKAQDAELATQVAQMNSAPDDKKLNLLAAIVTRMTEQRATMNEKMATMQDNMMKHMMMHAMHDQKEMSEHSAKHEKDAKDEDETDNSH